MPFSTGLYKLEIFEHIKQTLPKESKVLDVGPGVGVYGKNLRFPQFDAVEIYEPYIKKYELDLIYNKVYCSNILDFDWSGYDYIIFGDVIEHIDLTPAQKLITDITNKGIKCLVGVPYNYEQGESHGNIYETHLQPDLTNENMKTRYPELKYLMGDIGYGYYINY